MERSTAAKIALPRAKSQIGAPRPMKKGTIVSPWRYDGGASSAPHSANCDGLPIRYIGTAVFPVSLDGPVTLR
jgi:hypothetical protein